MVARRLGLCESPAKEKYPGSVTLPGRAEMWSREIYPWRMCVHKIRVFSPSSSPSSNKLNVLGSWWVFLERDPLSKHLSWPSVLWVLVAL